MNAFCILFTDTYDNERVRLGELLTLRNSASVPFGGRYRLIDFMLSSLVGSSVRNIGILTKNKYKSLMDHVGWGKDWDLNRKNGGLKILTPFATEATLVNDGQFELLKSVHGYIDNALEEYCIIADTNFVINLDFKALFDAHNNTNADITVLVRESENCDIELCMEDSGKIQDALIHTSSKNEKKLTALNVMILKKSLLRRLIDWGVTYGFKNFYSEVITKKCKELNIFGYKHDGYCKKIDSQEVYLQANLDMLKEDVKNELFYSGHPILTRIKDTVPTKYGDNAKVLNSLIADGCIIDGNVENSIIFRNVKIEKNAKIKNSVVMQNTIVEENSDLNCVIADKNVRITENKTIIGCDALPVVINKNKIV